MSIQQKLVTLISATSLSVIAVGTLAIYSINLITDRFTTVISEQTPILQSTQHALLAIDNATSNLDSALLVDESEDPKLIEIFETEFDKYIFEFDMYLNAIALGSESEEFKALNSGHTYNLWIENKLDKELTLAPHKDESKEILEEIGPFIESFTLNSHKAIALKKEIMKLKSKGEESGASKLTSDFRLSITKTREDKRLIINAAEEYIQKEAEEIKESIEEQESLSKTIYSIVIGLVIFNIAAVLIFGIYFVRKLIVLPIQNLTQMAIDISIGKLDSKIDPKILESKDEIGKLAQAFDRTVISLKLAMKEQSKNQEKA